MNILRPSAVIAALVLVAPAQSLTAQQVTIDRNWTAPIEPLRIFENVYYVGTEDLASYLITTPQGHVLVDSGVAQNAATIRKGIEQLGFKLADVKYLLTTQAHFDHVAAHAELQRLTGAQVVASDGDAELLETGGKTDYHFGPAYNFPRVRVNRRIKDGETVTIGDVVLTAHLTPGHTQGTTTWVMPVTSAGVPTNVVFVGSTAVNPGVKLVGNIKYPRIAEDFAASFERLKHIKVDVFLTAHLSATGGLEKIAKLRNGASPNPFIDPAGYAAYLERSKRTFEAELAKQASSKGL
jgi:metallo-beta-lactamase class B